MEPYRPEPSPDLRTLRIICFALLSSVVLVNLVLTFLYATGDLPQGEVKKLVPPIFFTLALILIAASPAVKRALLKRSDSEHVIGAAERAGDYMSANIIAFALREGAGLIGFVLSLLTGNPWWSWGLGGAAVLAMIVDWPKGSF